MTRFWYLFATKWNKNEENEDSVAALEMVHQAKLKLEIENVLYQNGIERSQTYLGFIHQGRYEELIKNMYEKDYKG